MIGIIGKKYSGKDTVADIICKLHPDYIKLAFADTLKDTCMSLFGFTHDQVYNDKETIDSNWNITPREVLQFVGTELVRNNMNKLLPDIGDNFWIKTIDVKAKLAIQNGKKIIISDVRFENEVNYIKQNGGIIIKVTRPDIANFSNFANHVSEQLETIPDFEIINNSTIADLENMIKQIKILN